MRSRVGFLVLATGFTLWPATSLAQAYGTGSQILVIPAAAFRGESSADHFNTTYGVALSPTTDTETFLDAPIDLPSGAAIEEIRVLVTDLDASPGSDIAASLNDFGQGVSTATTCGPYYISGWLNSSSGLTGTGILHLGNGSFVTVRHRESCNSNDSYMQYYLRVELLSTKHSLSGAVVVWHRQLTPAPGTATFNDVPTSDPFFRAIEALGASGVTSGCGGGNFCPNDVVTRNQLAKFLANALGLHFPE